jgi:Protein of unknown function (DUF3551)
MRVAGLVSITLVTITLAMVVLAATDAVAGSWCAVYSGRKGGSENCTFSSQGQCYATVSGVGGWCRPNPFPGTAFGTGGTWGSGPSRQYRY